MKLAIHTGSWFDQLRLWPSRIVGRWRLRRAVLERIRNRTFLVLPEVFNPTVFRSGRVLAEYIADAADLTPPSGNATALDLGTGCGVQGVFAAARGYEVTATDVNPEAVRCARANAILNRMEDWIGVLEGDLFAPVGGQTFDLVIFNPPFFDGEPGSTFDLAWRSVDCVERFAAELPAFLRPGGSALVIWSSHAEAGRLLDALDQAGLETSVAHRHKAVGEVMTVFRARSKLRR